MSSPLSFGADLIGLITAACLCGTMTMQYCFYAKSMREMKDPSALQALVRHPCVF